MRYTIWLLLLVTMTQASVLKAKALVEGNEKYLIFEEGVVVDKIKTGVVLNEIKEKNTIKNSANFKNSKQKEEATLIKMIENDNLEEFEKYLKQENAIKKLNSKLKAVKAFAYPFHQAIINKSYKILLKMISIKQIKVELKEASGTQTKDILKLYDFENYDLGKELIKEYLKRIEG